MARGRPSRATLYARLDAAMTELRERLGGLPPPKESEFVWSDIWHLEAHHSIVPGVAGAARLVPVVALTNESFSVAALRQAATRGRLDAVQGADGVWRSSRKAVEDYARTKGRRTRRDPG